MARNCLNISYLSKLSKLFCILLFLAIPLGAFRLPGTINSPKVGTTSKSFFSKCSHFGSKYSYIERLKKTVALKRLIASFDISKNISFFKLETCQSLIICIVTKSDVITKEDFGKSNVEIWAKLVKAFKVKGVLEMFVEKRHRKTYGRSALEASCVDGFFVFRHLRHSIFKRRRQVGEGKRTKSSKGKDDFGRRFTSMRRFSKKAIRSAKKRKRGRKNGKAKAKEKKQRRNRRNRKRSRSKYSKECQEDNSLCLRTCVGWEANPQQCVRMRISCSFFCSKKNNWKVFSERNDDDK